MNNAHNHITAVLLAGGQARRMGGGDKCLLELAGSPMLAWVIERLETQITTMVINANGQPDRFSLFGKPVIADTISGNLGPLAGVLTGMRWANTNTPDATHIVTLPTDAPFLPLNLIEKLNNSQIETKAKITLAASNGRTHPVFGLWQIDLADDLQNALQNGTRKVMHWVENHPTETVNFPDITIGQHQLDPFFNTNTPENMQEARLILENIFT